MASPIQGRVLGIDRISAVITNLLDEMRVFGLLGSYFERFSKSTGEVAEAIAARLALSRAVLQIAESEYGLKMSSGLPFLYNAASWRHRELGGYVRAEDEIKPSEITISYLTAWLAALEKSFDVSGRLSKAAISYAAQKRQFHCAFGYLIDLYSNGYVLERKAFQDAYARLLRLYACLQDETTLTDMARDIASDSEIQAWNETIQKIIDSNAPNIPKVNNEFEWLLDQTLTWIEKAKASSTADEWLLTCSVTYGLVELVQRIHQEFLPQLELSVAHSAILTQQEEIRADLGSFSRIIRVRAPYRPFLYTPDLMVTPLRVSYENLYGKAWLENLTADRLVIPNCLKSEFLNDHGASKKGQLLGSKEWTLYSEKLAFPMSLIAGIEPIFMRKTLFPVGLILKQINAARAFSRLTSEEVSSTVEWLYYGRFDLQSLQIDVDRQEAIRVINSAHQNLCLNELQEELINGGLGRFPNKTERLLRLREEYPWYGPIARESGIANDESGNHVEAARLLTTAVTLEPIDEISWHSLGVICLHLSSRVEFNFCLAIENMISRSKAR